MCIPTAWFVLRFRPGRRDPFREHCARLPRPPAPAVLDAGRRDRLRRSVCHEEERRRG
ncbi:hypothetical protein [Streptomyces adustus]|uniref:hypothetical protein n=1 Tax=Streptomyces adustus TaxID=1609272 RepID=UPI0012E05E1D|nr:hypothetical protein [Streptomyces adustus]